LKVLDSGFRRNDDFYENRSLWRTPLEKFFRAGCLDYFSLGSLQSFGFRSEKGVTVFTTVLDVVIGGLIMGGIYALIAVGLGLQYGVGRVLNVSHGEFIMIGAFAT